jgi:uncharacterized protein
MTIPDANLLLYAHNTADPDHMAAKKWWSTLLEGADPVGIPIVVVLAFLRLSTSSKVLATPLSPAESTECIATWFTSPLVSLLNPGPNHLSTFFDLVCASGAAGNLTTDAEIAALALEYRAEVHSNDQDFGRFKGLRWRNPLRD